MSIIGNPILLSGGGNGSKGGLFNFPTTFAESEPTPICKGHIWVKSSNGSYVNSVAFVDNIATATTENNSLIYEIFDTGNLAIEIDQNISITSEGKTVSVAFNGETVGNHPWLAGEVEGLGSIYLPYPRVFIKKDNMLYIETAYVWTGTEWHMLSESDTYLICGSNQNEDYSSDTFYPWTIYNRSDNTNILEHSTIDTSYTRNIKYSYCVAASTGEYMAYRIDSADTTMDIKIYRRTGDTFTLNQTITTDTLKAMFPSDSEVISGNFNILKGYYYRNKLNGSNGLAMSGDGSLLFIPCAYNTNTNGEVMSYTNFIIVILENVNGQYIYKNYFTAYQYYTYNSGSSVSNSSCNISASLDGSVIATEVNVYYSGTSNSYSNRTASCVSIGDAINGYSSNTLSTGIIFGCAVAPDGSYGVYSTRDDDVNRYEYVAYSVNKQSKTTSTLATPMSYSNMGIGVCITPDNYLWFLTDNSEDRLYLGQGKYADGVYTQISQCYASVSNLFAFTDGQYNMYSNIFYSAAFDNKNNIMFITSFYGTNVVTMTKTNDKVTGLTKLSNIPKQMRGGDMTSMFITPYL